MARTILFNFTGSTRSATTAFRTASAGLRTVGRNARRTMRDFRAMNTASVSSTGFLGSLGAKAGMIGAAFSRLSGPFGMILGFFRRIISVGLRVIKTLTKMGLIVGAIGVGIGLKAMFDAGDFERTMVRVRMTSQATTDEWEKMSGAIEKVIRESEFMPKAIAEAGMNLARMGLRGDPFAEMLPAARMFATSMGVEINTAAEILLKALNVFKVDMRDAVTVVDIFANASNNAMTDAQGLATALRFLGPTAKSEGQSIETAMAVIMAAINEGGETAFRAGSLLRSVFSRLSAPTTAGKEVLNELKLSLEDIDPLLSDYVTILERMNRMTPQQVRRFWTVETKGLASSLLGASRAESEDEKSKLRTYLDLLRRRGIAERQILEVNKTAAQQWDILKGSISGALINLGDLLIKTLGVTEGLAGASTAVNRFSDTLKNISPVSVENFFGAVWDDVKSGRIFLDIFDAMLDYGEAMLPMFEFLGKAIGSALLKGILAAVGALNETATKAMYLLFGGEDWETAKKALPEWLYRGPGVLLGDIVEFPKISDYLEETRKNIQEVRGERSKLAPTKRTIEWDRLRAGARGKPYGAVSDEMFDRLYPLAIEYTRNRATSGNRESYRTLLRHIRATSSFPAFDDPGKWAIDSIIRQRRGMEEVPFGTRYINRMTEETPQQRQLRELERLIATNPSSMETMLGVGMSRVSNDNRVQNTWIFGGPRNDLGSRATSRDPGSGK